LAHKRTTYCCQHGAVLAVRHVGHNTIFFEHALMHCNCCFAAVESHNAVLLQVAEKKHLTKVTQVLQCIISSLPQALQPPSTYQSSQTQPQQTTDC
jgi:hypothetical protein